jgi:hypothetical protein
VTVVGGGLRAAHGPQAALVLPGWVDVAPEELDDLGGSAQLGEAAAGAVVAAVERAERPSFENSRFKNLRLEDSGIS